MWRGIFPSPASNRVNCPQLWSIIRRSPCAGEGTMIGRKLVRSIRSDAPRGRGWGERVVLLPLDLSGRSVRVGSGVHFGTPAVRACDRGVKFTPPLPSVPVTGGANAPPATGSSDPNGSVAETTGSGVVIYYTCHGNSPDSSGAEMHRYSCHLSRELLDPHIIQDDIAPRRIPKRVGLHHARDAQISHGTRHAGQDHALPKPP